MGFIGVLVGGGKRARIARHRLRHELVVQREIWIAERERIEGRVAETQGRGRGRESLLVTKYVLDVLGADVARGHHLVDRGTGGLLAEQLDEEDESHGLALDGAA